eukprot:5896035-Pyramimonas_sp.AAC.1
MPVSSELRCTKTLAWSLVSVERSGGWVVGSLPEAAPSFPFQFPLALVCLRVPLTLLMLCGQPFSRMAHCSW